MNENKGRLVMTLPINGRRETSVTVHELVTDDGAEVYTVTDDVWGHGGTFTKPELAFSKAFEFAAWAVRVRKATAKDFA